MAHLVFLKTIHKILGDFSGVGASIEYFEVSSLETVGCLLAISQRKRQKIKGNLKKCKKIDHRNLS